MTGGIAAGKSTITSILAEHGAVVIDSDRIAREVVEPGSVGIDQVKSRFGTDVLHKDGSLNRAAMGQIVFADSAARGDLEQIIHPLIARRGAELLAQSADDAIVVHDVPLLVERDLGARYHLVLVVLASLEKRIERMIRDREMSLEQAQSRIASQADDDERRLVADDVIHADVTVDRTRAALERWWQNRVLPYHANLQHGVRAPRDRSVRLVPPPGPPRTWRVQAMSVVKRLQWVLAGHDVSIEHIGSTSIPGLWSKDVIDIQIQLRDWESVQEVGALLAAAGFPGKPSFDNAKARWLDVPDSDTGGAASKWLAANADQGRAVNLHVRPAGSDSSRYALDFRDLLRCDPLARADYAQFKAKTARVHTRSDHYALAKERYFKEIWPQLRQSSVTRGIDVPPS